MTRQLAAAAVLSTVLVCLPVSADAQARSADRQESVFVETEFQKPRSGVAGLRPGASTVPSEWLDMIDPRVTAWQTRSDQSIGNAAFIAQVGEGNVALVAQTGSENLAIVYQQGNHNIADLKVEGSRNKTGVFQFGDDNQYSLDFQGIDLHHLVVQTGHARATQSGSGRIPFGIQQRGNGVEVHITHNGSVR